MGEMAEQEQEIYTDTPADVDAELTADEVAEIDREGAEGTGDGEPGAQWAETSAETGGGVPPAPAAPTPEEIERRQKKVAQAFARYTKTVTEQLDFQEADLFPCVLCPDAHPGFLDVNDAGRVPEEVAAVVDSFLGRTAEAEYRPAPNIARCDACDGLGKVESGSRVATYRHLACAKCNGTGYYPPPSGPTLPAVNGAVAGDAQAAERFTAEPGTADPWGSPRILADGTENPNYGRMPQFKDPALP